jgi:hypothetical protein
MSIYTRPEARGSRRVPRVLMSVAALTTLGYLANDEGQVKKQIKNETSSRELYKYSSASKVGKSALSFYKFNEWIFTKDNTESSTTTTTTTSTTIPKVTPPTTTPTTSPPAPVETGDSNAPTGILRAIAGCESGGAPDAPINYTAQNPESTASGGFQIEQGTWNNFAGYTEAKYAPPYIQNEKGEQLFAEEGTRPWTASEACWDKAE